MDKVTHEQPTSFDDEAIQELISQLNHFFNNSIQSTEILKTIFEQYYPSSTTTIDQSIIDLYSKSLYKPYVNKLLEKIIEYLNLNNHKETSYKINQQTKYSNLLHNAISKNYEHIFRLLLQCGCDPNSLLTDHKTPLAIAVVTNNIHPTKRLEYIQLLIEYGANAVLRDKINVSPFRNLCGVESNYPIVYTFYRDHLLSVYPDEVQSIFNAGLTNAIYHWCVPIVIDLIEHGAIFPALKKVDGFIYFLTQMSPRLFNDWRSITFINPFLLCLIEILSHNLPCENYSIFIEKFLELIFIPAICLEAQKSSLTGPSMTCLQKFLYLSFYFGYLRKEIIIRIQKQAIPKVLTTLIRSLLVSEASQQYLHDILNQYFDDLVVKYYQNPVSLRTLSIRKIRQSMKQINQKNLEQLNLNSHLKNLLLPKNN